MTRRAFLATAATAAFTDRALSVVESAAARAPVHALEAAEDEGFWSQVQQAFTLDRAVVNFNNGGVCPSPRVVHEALKRTLDYSNQAPSYYMWRHAEPEVENVRRRLARMFGADAEEVAITRNASEALETCLMGLDLEPGDEILTSDQDYPRMITTIKQRELREKVKLVQVVAPSPPRSVEQVVKAFEAGITDKTKLILVSHVVFLNGTINPVRQVCDLGRSRGVPVIVDGAHAFAQFPMRRDDLGCDYYGVSLHKWLLAPVGTGMLCVRREKVKGLWPLMAATEEQADNIRKFEEIGTHPAANHNAIAEALTFTEMIGLERKAARLRYLRSRWADALKGEKKVVFHTNLSPQFSCGLTTVEIKGTTPAALSAWLMDKKGIFTVGITHPRFQGIRVTPNVYTTLDEIDRFREAMLEAATKGID
ncbi:MAG: aminotransferase class V-fold PLP-dependent enzyme [Fimbriimonadaceae bacterium]|nr:aminotransferase class V-fold PLP-dependent enzyme [Fimbriimonadaceae bacterium]